ncbi:hypothetical protein [Synergistes jonesii]|uniref:hypothetical protein n=1 Tax=Synergistes jonesii TaxID=2754 RepID=UPI00248D7689|nr:hypothetical protein [Synergistes jonesii]
MRVKIAELTGKAAKILILAAVLASFFFIARRITTKEAYIAHEKAQCRAIAISAALCAADAALSDPAVASLVKESGALEYISDHQKTPDNISVSVTISSNGGKSLIRSRSASGWNSRSPQRSEFSAVLDEDGKTLFRTEGDAEAARLITEARKKIGAEEKLKEHTFTFPNERPCPAPFAAKSALVDCLGEKKIWIIFFDKSGD